ncbi:MAG: hypothetical protein M3O88_04630 [Actinomycetota bacterium]|nr:hypothetical protein [Actinomycetota bacterium]
MWSSERSSSFPPEPRDARCAGWVDSSGRLHLRIQRQHGHWWCGELTTTTSLGYGTYVFELDTAASSIDRNALLGLFTWDDAAGEHHQEIDIELSRWGSRHGSNASFAVQPYQVASNAPTLEIRERGGTPRRRSTGRPDRWTSGASGGTGRLRSQPA